MQKESFIVLNTRPKHQSHALTTQLKSINADVIELPLIEIVPISLPKKTYEADTIIFLSANAVNCFFKQATISDCCVIGIGSATVAALKKHNIKNTLCPTTFSSDGLIAMPELQDIKNKKITIICGENSKSLLPQTLSERGAMVDSIICYRREVLFYDEKVLALALQATHIVVTSSEIFQSLLDLFKAHHSWLIEKTLCVVNNEMRQRAEYLGFTSIIQSNNATNEAMVEALDDNRNKTGRS